MNVLSLFDGISCGREALKRTGIRVDSYYASEIEPNAIAIAKHNHSDIIEIGSVTDIEYDCKKRILYTANGDFYVDSIDMIIGGSPCTDFSSIGYAKGMLSGSTEITSLEQYLSLKQNGVCFEGQSYLFWEYIRLLNSIKPKYFLLENVVMAKKWQAVINNAIGCCPIQINSSLVSAQNRPRLYWTNIPGISLPDDKHILLTSILDNKASKQDISACQTIQKCFPKLEAKYGYIPSMFNAYNITEIKDKACALSRGSMVTSSCASLLFVKDKSGKHVVDSGVLDGKFKTKLRKGRYNLRRLSLREMERLQTLPDDYTAVSGVSMQKRSAAIGNAWTVDVIAHIFSYI